MIDSEYIRAEYDDDRDSYVSVGADWIDGQPSLVYIFDLQPSETERGAWDGILVKQWIDEDGSGEGEYYIFDRYKDKDAFDADIAKILTYAEALVARENVDAFLAVIDILKERAVTRGLDEPSILDWEGLFEYGPEDAYSLHEFGDLPRLHDHVECDDECWYLHVARVVDAQQNALGWGLFVVDFPDLTTEASVEEMIEADDARVLLLDHHNTERDAKLAKRAFLMFMENERLENPEYAHTNDTDVLAGLATDPGWDEQSDSYIWATLNGEALRAFLAGTAPHMYMREKWKPRQDSIVDKFFEQFPQPVWLEDQLRTALDQQAGVKAEIDEDSPWNNLNLD